jgi:hypothetical protein
MSECKHGLKSGCAYCHTTPAARRTTTPPPAPRRRSRSASMSEKMNDRLTALNRRLRQIRGEG